jgi:hypothetical protein
MRAQKLLEEAAEKERDDHFNTIRPMISMKQEWRVKEKTSMVTLTTSDDGMDLLDDDESPLIKDGSSPLTDIDINMVLMLLAEFRGVNEQSAQLCLGPKEVVFKKPEESSQHLKPLYVRGHINGRLFSRMVVDGGATINLMPYSVFKKLEREDDELVKTILTLNGMGGGGNPMEARGVVSMDLTEGESCSLPCSSLSRCKVTIVLFLVWIHANRCVPSTLHQFLI